MGLDNKISIVCSKIKKVTALYLLYCSNVANWYWRPYWILVIWGMSCAIFNGFNIFLVAEKMGLDTKISFVCSKMKMLPHYTCFGKSCETVLVAILDFGDLGMCYAIFNAFIVFLVPENMGLGTKIAFVCSKINMLQLYTLCAKAASRCWRPYWILVIWVCAMLFLMVLLHSWCLKTWV